MLVYWSCLFVIVILGVGFMFVVFDVIGIFVVNVCVWVLLVISVWSVCVKVFGWCGSFVFYLVGGSGW